MDAYIRHTSDTDDIARHSNARSLAREYVKPARNYICRLVTEWVLPCRSNSTLLLFHQSTVQSTFSSFIRVDWKSYAPSPELLDAIFVWLLYMYPDLPRRLAFSTKYGQ
jgi:hypothetical protein